MHLPRPPIYVESCLIKKIILTLFKTGPNEWGAFREEKRDNGKNCFNFHDLIILKATILGLGKGSPDSLCIFMSIIFTKTPT